MQTIFVMYLTFKHMTTLKNVLIINALSSGATGIALIVFAQLMATLFGVPHVQPFWGTGIFLVVFAALVLYAGSQNPINSSLVQLIIVLDSLWVVTSLVIVLFHLFHLSLIGYVLISAVAIWVAAMAYLQSAGLKKTARA